MSRHPDPRPAIRVTLGELGLEKSMTSVSLGLGRSMNCTRTLTGLVNATGFPEASLVSTVNTAPLWVGKRCAPLCTKFRSSADADRIVTPVLPGWPGEARVWPGNSIWCRA